MTYSLRTSSILSLVLIVTVTLLPALAFGQDPDRTAEGPVFDEGMITCAVGALFRLIEGHFGALVMVVSGLGAIIAAAMGGYRAAVGMLVVAVGSFILRALVGLFFGGHFVECTFDQ